MNNTPIKLNLGCGTHYMEGYENCDVLTWLKADKHFDLNTFPYPFPDNYADEIFMDNVLEHLDDVPGVVTELHRILKPNGLAIIKVPYARSDSAFQDPTHKQFFTERTMEYFSSESDYNFYSPKARFVIEKNELTSWGISTQNKIRNLLPFRKFLRFFLNNMYDGILFEMRAVK